MRDLMETDGIRQVFVKKKIGNYTYEHLLFILAGHYIEKRAKFQILHINTHKKKKKKYHSLHRDRRLHLICQAFDNAFNRVMGPLATIIATTNCETADGSHAMADPGEVIAPP